MVTGSGKLPGEAGDPIGGAGQTGETADAPDLGVDESLEDRSVGVARSGNQIADGTGNGNGGSAAKQPSLVAGMTMLGLAGVLMVVVLVNPPMPNWLRVLIVVVALATVGALLVYAMLLFRTTKRGGGRG